MDFQYPSVGRVRGDKKRLTQISSGTKYKKTSLKFKHANRQKLGGEEILHGNAKVTTGRNQKLKGRKYGKILQKYK